MYAPGDEKLPAAIRSVNFARTTFGVQTAWEDRIQRYRETAEVRAEEFSSHAEEVVLDPGRCPGRDLPIHCIAERNCPKRG